MAMLMHRKHDDEEKWMDFCFESFGGSAAGSEIVGISATCKHEARTSMKSRCYFNSHTQTLLFLGSRIEVSRQMSRIDRNELFVRFWVFAIYVRCLLSLSELCPPWRKTYFGGLVVDSESYSLVVMHMFAHVLINYS